MPIDTALGLLQRRFYPLARRADHLRINSQFPAILDLNIWVSGRPAIQHRGDIVFRVAGGEQHSRNRKNAFGTAVPQRIEPGRQHRVAKFQIPMLHRILRES